MSWSWSSVWLILVLVQPAFSTQDTTVSGYGAQGMVFLLHGSALLQTPV